VTPVALGLDSDGSLVAVGLGAARTVPVAWLVPAFGGVHLSPVVRLGLGVGLSVLCLPRLGAMTPLEAGPALWVVLLAREAAVGLTLGFVASLIFRAAETAGRITDVARGANLAEVLSPSSGERASPLGEVTALLAVVIFLELGGLGHLAVALGRSYDAVPVAAAATPAQLGRVAALVVAASAQMLEAAVGLAAPALVALLLADLVLGVIGRAAPQIPLYFVGMPAKALLGVGAALVGLATLDTALVSGFRGWAGLLERAVAVWR
jgi:type III secretion protein SpaR/YscT/HrcT